MDDYYDGDTSTTNKPMSDGNHDDKDSGKTFLLSKSVCPGMSVGEEGKFKVTRELEDELECVYMEPSKDESKSEPEPAMASESDSMFD